MLSADIRRSFIDYFAARGHRHDPSSSLVPAGDPTLLFTNAGMVQYKRVFQGLEHRDYNRAVTSQKCVRAGGKHNDLEQVGHTARHHTFFEMLGNFSFGDYFKKEAIEFAWEWVTSEDYLGIHPDRLYFSVHHSDDEARRLWHDVTGADPSRIYGMGDSDNFWQMGDTGPCGPCSELFVDVRRREEGGGRRPIPTLDEFEELAEAGHLLEIWNLVFMQFDQAADGSRTPLPAPSVDTGAGLERIAAVLQGVDSNFDTDLFMSIIAKAEDVIGAKYDDGPAGAGFRVLADHARAVAFLLADGVYPTNDGRGYVLRRILRRAVRHAYLMGRREPTLVHLTNAVVEQMGGMFPELTEKASHIEDVTRAEEERKLLEHLWHALDTTLKLELDLFDPDLKTSERTEAKNHWRQLILGEITAHTTSDHNGKLIFPGAFNPLHKGHEKMLSIAEAKTDLTGAYELSIFNVDKPPLDYTDISTRLKQFTNPVWLTRLPTFLEKARRFRAAHFVLGADTLDRINDPGYYGSSTARDDALAELVDLDCRFVVFGRAATDGFLTLEDIPGLPESITSRCIEIKRTEFEETISSTALRSSST